MSLFSKFPSYKSLATGTTDVLKRFPFVVLCCFLGTAAGVIILELESASVELIYQKLILIFGLGIPLFIIITLLSEKKKWPPIKCHVINIIGIILLALYYFSFPETITEVDYHLIRYLLLCIALISMVSFLPFTGKEDKNGFWQFNKSLLMKLLNAALYTAVLHIGLQIALAAADHLFGMEVNSNRYFQLWIIVNGIFFPMIFLSGVPNDYDAINKSESYPKSLKVFAQYILLPLVVLYFVILISYEFKIIFSWNWPKGWVSQLVLWYSVVGLFSMLLLHPLRDKSEHKWIKIFFKWFFLALIPLVSMLLLSIIRRISDYGITENRYFVLAMAIGLTVGMLYFIFSKGKDIRLIPIIICLIALLGSYGPQSAFNLSLNDQKSKLQELLVKYNILVDGKIVTTQDEILYDDKKEISSKVSYIIATHGLDQLEPWLDEAEYANLDSLTKYNQDRELIKLMGFIYISKWDDPNSSYINITTYSIRLYDIKKYDYFLEVDNIDSYNNFILDDNNLVVNLSEANNILDVTFSGDLLGDSVIFEFDLKDTVLSLTQAGYVGYDNAIERKHMTFYQSDSNIDMEIVIKYISGNKESDSLKITNIDALLFFSKVK